MTCLKFWVGGFLEGATGAAPLRMAVVLAVLLVWEEAGAANKAVDVHRGGVDLNPCVNAYLNCYQRDFRGTKPERKAWEAYRRKQIEGAVGRIDLLIQDMQINVRGEEAQVRFKQHYRADNFTDSGNKELSLVRADGKWLIKKEFFDPDGK